MQQKNRTRAQNWAAPLADAGPYAYDLPATRDAGPPAIRPGPAPAPSGRAWGWGASLGILAMSFCVHALDDLSALTTIQSYMVVYCVGFILWYWAKPKPRPGFVPWALKVVGVFLNLYVGFVTVPASLRGHIPEPLAFGLPAFVTLLILFWVSPLRLDKTTPLWQWLLYIAGFAAGWAFWAGPSALQ